MLYGRTEDYPYAPDGGRHNQNFVVVPAKDYKEGDKIEDESNGFTYPHLTHEWRYTATYDAAQVAMVAMVTLELTVLMKWACRWQRRVSATPHDKILKADPLVKDGLPEASMIDLVLTSCKTAPKELKLLPRPWMKRFCRGNIIVVADKMKLYNFGNPLRSPICGPLNSLKTAMPSLPIPTIWDMWISRTRTMSLLQRCRSGS